MAGDDMSPDGYTRWYNIYGDDPNKYKGFWKYYNNETPFGRANVSFPSYNYFKTGTVNVN